MALISFLMIIQFIILIILSVVLYNAASIQDDYAMAVFVGQSYQKILFLFYYKKPLNRRCGHIFLFHALLDRDLRLQYYSFGWNEKEGSHEANAIHDNPCNWNHRCDNSNFLLAFCYDSPTDSAHSP